MAVYEHLRALAQSATPGPWTLDGPHSVWKINGGEDDIYIAEPELRCDAAYIATASPDVVLSLIADVDQLRAERDALQARLDAVLAAGRESCREWDDEKWNRCGKPAEFILWGKLYPPEAMGPRCRDCAVKHTRTDRWTVEQSAIFDLRPFAAARGGTDDPKPCASCGSTNNNGVSCFNCGRSDTDE